MYVPLRSVRSSLPSISPTDTKPMKKPATHPLVRANVRGLRIHSLSYSRDRTLVVL